MTIAELFAKLKIEIDQGALNEVDKAIGSLKTALTGLAVYVGADYLSGLVMSAVDAGGHINDLSQSAGVTTDTLQELGYAAQLNSSSMDGMAAGLGQLSRTMAEAKAGGEAQQKTFRDMGIAYRNADGTLRATEDVLGDVADRIQSMPDGAEKTALSMDVLGKSGKDLIPTLNGGSAGLAAMSAEARDLGIVMDKETIGKLDDFGDSVDKVKMTLNGLKNQAVAALLPYLQKLADSFLDWYKANRKIIGQRLEQVIHALAVAFGVVGKVLSAVGTIIGEAVDHFDTLLMAIGIYVVASLAAAGETAIAWLAALAPILIAITTFALLYLAIDDIIGMLRGKDSVFGKFFAYFGVAPEDIKRVADAMRFAFGSAIDSLQNKLTNFMTRTKGAFTKFFEWIGGDEEKRFNQAIANDSDFRITVADIISNERTNAIRASRGLGPVDTTRGFDPHDLAGGGHYAVEGEDKRTMSGPPSLAYSTPYVSAAGRGGQINAPIVINIDGSKNPESVGVYVKQVLEDHIGSIFRQAAVGTGVAQ